MKRAAVHTALSIGAGLSLGCHALPARAPNTAQFLGFAAPWDPRSDSSIARYGGQLGGLVSGWIALDSGTFQPIVLFPDAARRTTGPRPMALVTSFHGTRFHPETIRAIASDSGLMARTSGAIAAAAARGEYRGIILDFESMTPDDLTSLRRVITAIADSARRRGVSPVGVAIPATDTAAYPARYVIESADFAVVMLYDQHWLTSPPGPIAAPDWARRWLGVRLSEVGAAKIVAAFPTYGYLWRPDSATAVVGFNDALRIAAQANVPVNRDFTSMTLHAQLNQPGSMQGFQWSTWFADADLLARLVSDAQTVGVTQFALWRLGLEDPAIWTRVVR